MSLLLRGKQGKTLLVSGDVVRIEKKGLLTGKREKSILIRNVTSIEVKKPGGFPGFIQFSIAGGVPRDSSGTATGGAFDAAKDENSVVFNGKENHEMALKIKEYVEEWQANSSRGSAVAPPPAASSSAAAHGVPADEIRKLKALVDEGLITSDDFEKKKRQLLGI